MTYLGKFLRFGLHEDLKKLMVSILRRMRGLQIFFMKTTNIMETVTLQTVMTYGRILHKSITSVHQPIST